MVVPVLPQASAAISEAVYTYRTRGLRAEPDSGKTKQKNGGGNFVCSPFSILLVFVIAMLGARGRTVEEMERLFPLREVPALLRLATHSNMGSSSGGKELSGDAEGVSEEGMESDTETELDVVSRIYVDGRLASNTYFQTFKQDVLRQWSDGDEQKRPSPVQLIDSAKADETARDINEFVRAVTRGHITDLVSAGSITPSTRLLLLSAAFFKSPWSTPFEESGTKKAPFYAILHSHDDSSTEHGAHGGEGGREEKGEEGRSDQSHDPANESQPRFVTQSVDTMYVVLEPSSHFYVAVNDEVTAIGLPYADENCVMYVVQPNDPRNLGRLMRRKTEESEADRFPTFDDVVSSMREWRQDMEDVEVELALPKFTLRAADNKLDLTSLFSRLLRIQAPFDSGVADFSRISGDQTLFMSTFVHQADIEVDEKGTVATAATAAAVSMRSMTLAERRLSVTINKPFAFQIIYHLDEELIARDRRRAREGQETTADGSALGDLILFSGCVTDALAAQQ